MRNVQNWPAVVADHLEKGNNLLTWKVTANTLPLVQILGGVLVAVLVLPWPLVLMLAKILLGIKLFVVDSLYARFPEFKEKYDSTSRFWRELPCNRDLEGADAGGSGATTASADGAGTGAGLTRSQSDTVAARRKTSSTAAAAPATPAAAAGATASSRSSSSPTSQLSPPRTRKVRETDALLAKLGIHEDIVDSWTAVLVNRSSLLKSQHGRLYLTTNHLCFVRGSGEKDRFVLCNFVEWALGSNQPPSQSLCMDPLSSLQRELCLCIGAAAGPVQDQGAFADARQGLFAGRARGV